MINALQHIGVGVADLERSWAFYRRLGFDVPMNVDQSYIPRLAPLTGGNFERSVVFAGNLMGGAAIEIFQFTSIEPRRSERWKWGDPGISSIALKVPDLAEAMRLFSDVEIIFQPRAWPAYPEWKAALVQDPDGILLNLIQIPEMTFSLRIPDIKSGGVIFPTIAVSDMERALSFYRDILHYTEILYDWEGVDPALTAIPGGKRRQRRVMLRDPRPATSFFNFYLDRGMIELVEVRGKKAAHLFHGRRWGDIGINEVCFDVYDIEGTFTELSKKGAGVVVAPNVEEDSFDGGSSAFFGYVVDPDNTMIELAEPTRLSLTKKLSLNLRKRKPGKPFPSWLMKMSRFNRYKD
ncbi:hypothetical protein GF338_00580 [candidate division WOR-3 bacterium]|nr:hypothetical protein [candidate division WOR-3 bacterium]